ncbi:Mrp/NBP35 family ATP-binding protein [Propioniferax innocua]|uniref:Iron-sulfur cluster carrier protein n=1 Tax=Propioniferax innocua TaxID=1753 RepID=A0A542ZRQ9_9ACTN|nr:Mrp/NBP35 family ATP-binding protein [Propioniferax innocua]TQL62910.1 ATP-binding protein involved in chromosome partitioning [Propioniferax innocua]
MADIKTNQPDHPKFEAVSAALATVQDPEIKRPITELGMVGSVEFTGDDVLVNILLTTQGCPLKGPIREDVTKAVSAVEGIGTVSVDLGVMSDEQRAELRKNLNGGRAARDIPFSRPGNLTRIIAVSSGKGGVGKSSVTVNLAMALAQRGRSVGILDADIYGHSVPVMLGVADARPTSIGDDEESMILPVPTLGLKVMSIGMLKPQRDQVVAWRGPILDRAIQQMLADVHWGDLDYLVLDLPPGTGDVAISIGQKLPNAEVVVVTTPQAAAAEVAERAGTMASMMKQKVIGVVENMAWLETPDGERMEIFGSGGGQHTADALTRRLGYDVPLMSQVPLDPKVRESGDEGVPIVAADDAAENTSAQEFAKIAETLDKKGRSLAGLQLGVTPT